MKQSTKNEKQSFTETNQQIPPQSLPLPQPQPQPQPFQPMPNAPRPDPFANDKNSGLGIAALILSILGCTFWLGIFLAVIDLLKRDGRKKTCAIIAIIISVVWIFIGAAMTGGSNKKDVKITEEVQTAEPVEDEETEKEEKSNKIIESDTEITDGIERISSGEYLFITNEDLDKYCVNMTGAKIYVVTQIDDIKEDMIQSNLSDGFMMSNFYVGENYEKYKAQLKEKDIVGISGTVKGSEEYGAMGKSAIVEDCLVFAVGEKAETYKKDSSDDGLEEYFTITKEVANSGEDITEDEYKLLCETLDYEDILRNPDNNKDKYCVITGTVDQIIEGWFDSYTIFITDKNGNKWGCVYSYKEGESRLLEGDSATLYGKCEGTENTTTVLGKQVTLPRVDVEYIN